MGIRAALTAGTVLSLAATAVLSASAALIAGPAPAPRMGRSLPADYARLAAVPLGSAPALFAVIAVIYAACFFVSGLRRIRRERAAAREPDYYAEDAEAAPVSGRWSR